MVSVNHFQNTIGGRSVKIAAILLAIALPRVAAADEAQQLKLDRVFATRVQQHVTCDNSEHAPNPNCVLRYQGLEIEIVEPGSKELPNLFVRSVGKGQAVLPRSAHCLELLFSDKSLRSPDYLLDVALLLDGSGKIWPSLDRDMRLKCESQ